jgi:hypothetical protein
MGSRQIDYSTGTMRPQFDKMDEYPTSWVVDRDRALLAVEHLFTTGELAPWIEWHDDPECGG